MKYWCKMIYVNHFKSTINMLRLVLQTLQDYTYFYDEILKNRKKGSLDRNLKTDGKKCLFFFQRSRWLHLMKEIFGNIAKTLAEILKVYVIATLLRMSVYHTYICLSSIWQAWLIGPEWGENYFQIGIQICFIGKYIL